VFRFVVEKVFVSRVYTGLITLEAIIKS
jgi:hypothetical protein